MKRRPAALALATVLAGCMVEPDIVARPQVSDPTDSQAPPIDASPARKDGGIARDAGRPYEASVPPPGFDAGVPYELRCTDDARHLYLIDSAGALWRVRDNALEVESLGTPDCLTRGVVSGAVDQQGRLWVSLQDESLWWVSPGATSCTPSDLNVKPSTMAFVYDPDTDRELLYFVESSDRLAVVDPLTRALTSIGDIDTQHLIGTGLDTDLLALGELADTTLSLDWVNLDDAVVTPMWKIERKPQQTLYGAASWRGDIVLLLDSELVTYRRESGQQGRLAVDPPLLSSFVVLASSVCGASAK